MTSMDEHFRDHCGVFGIHSNSEAARMAYLGLYALQHHIKRLELDHIHALQIAAALKQKPFVETILPVETNIIIFEVREPFTARLLAENFKRNKILCIAISPTQVRMVTHLDINEQMVKEVVAFIQSL